MSQSTESRMAAKGMTPEYLERMAREIVKHDVLCGDFNKNIFTRHRLKKKRGPAWRAVQAALRLDGSFQRYIRMFSCAYDTMLFGAATKAVQACGGRMPSVSELVSHAPRWVRDVEPRLRRAQRVIDRLAQRHRRQATSGKINRERWQCLVVRTLLTEVYRWCGPSAEWDAARHRLWGCVRLVAMEKVRLLQSCGDHLAAAGTELRATDWLAIDLALLYGDDALVTRESLREYSQLSTLTVLFSLVQQYELDAPTADDTRWRAALADYTIKGRVSSLVTLQRRWHELLQLARSMLQEYVRHRDKQHAPPPLVRQLAVRFPQLVTAPRQWRELVAQGLIHVPPLNEYLAAVEAEDRADAAAPAAAAGTHSDNDDDDIMIVEEDVETIDLEGMESDHDDDDAVITHELSDTDESGPADRPDMTSIETKVGQVYRNLEQQINSQIEELDQIQNTQDSIYVDDSSSDSNVSEKNQNRNVKYYIGADQKDISKISNESVRAMINDKIGAQSSEEYNVQESIENEKPQLMRRNSCLQNTAAIEDAATDTSTVLSITEGQKETGDGTVMCKQKKVQLHAQLQSKLARGLQTKNIKYFHVKIIDQLPENSQNVPFTAQSNTEENDNQQLTVKKSSKDFTAMFGTNPVQNCTKNIQPHVAIPSMQIDSDSSSVVSPVTAMAEANSDTRNLDGGLPDGIALLERLDPATVQMMIVFSDEEDDMDDASQQSDETQHKTQNVSIQNDKTQDDAIFQNYIFQINNIGSESKNDSVANVAASTADTDTLQASIERESNKVATKSKARKVENDENTNNSKRRKTFEEDSIASDKLSKDDALTNVKVGVPITSHNIASRISFEGSDTSTVDIDAAEASISLLTRRNIEEDTTGDKMNDADTIITTEVKVEPSTLKNIKSRIAFQETDTSTPGTDVADSSFERKIATNSKASIVDDDQDIKNSKRMKTIEEDKAGDKLIEADAITVKEEPSTSQSTKSRISFEETDASTPDIGAAESSVGSKFNKLHDATKSKPRMEVDENVDNSRRRKTIKEDTAGNKLNEVGTATAINTNVKEEPSASQSIKSSITFEETDEKSQLDTRIDDESNTLKNEMRDVIDSEIAIDDLNMSTVLQDRHKDRETLLKKLQNLRELKVAIATKPDELIKQNVVDTSVDSEGMTGTASRLGGVGSDDAMSRDGSRGSSQAQVVPARAAAPRPGAPLSRLRRGARVHGMRMPQYVLEDPPAEIEEEEVTLTVEKLEEILNELKESQPEQAGPREACCAARRYLRQRAARERARARRGRPPPATPPHSHGAGAACTCCCRAALQAAPSPARLHAAAATLHTAIHAPYTQSKSSAAPPVVVLEPPTESAEEAKKRKKKRPRPPRRPAPGGGDTAEDAAGAVERPKASALKSSAERLADEYLEWLRAKNEHYKYFRLPARCTHDKQAKKASTKPPQPPTEPVGFQRTDGLQEARYITVPDLVPTKEFIKTLEKNITQRAPVVATEQAPATQNPPVTQTTYTVETNKAAHTRTYVSPTCLLVDIDEPARTDGAEALRLTVTVVQNQPTTDQQTTTEKQPTINQQHTTNQQPARNLKQPAINLNEPAANTAQKKTDMINLMATKLKAPKDVLTQLTMQDPPSLLWKQPVSPSKPAPSEPTSTPDVNPEKPHPPRDVKTEMKSSHPTRNEPATPDTVLIESSLSSKPILPLPPPPVWRCPKIQSVQSLAQISISDSPPKVTQPMETLTSHNTTLEQSSVPTLTLTEPLLATELPVVLPTPPQPATIALQQPTMVLQPSSEMVQMPSVPHLPGSASYQTRLLELPLSNLTTRKAGVSNSKPSKPPVAYLHTSGGSIVSKNKSVDEPGQEDSPHSMPLTAQISLSSLESAQAQVISSQAQILNQSHIQPIGITTSCGDEGPVLLVTIRKPPPPPHSLLADLQKLPQYISWEKFLARTKPPISTADFLKGRNPTTIELLRLPRGKPVMMVPGNGGDWSGGGLLVAEPWLPCDNPTYWTTLGARLTDVDALGDAGSSQDTPHHSDPSRLKVGSLAKFPGVNNTVQGANNTVQGAGDTGGSTVAPADIRLNDKYYKKLSDQPLVYAQVWTAVSDLGTLRSLVAGGGAGRAARAWWPGRRVGRPAAAAAALLHSWVSEDPVISIDSDSE